MKNKVRIWRRDILSTCLTCGDCRQGADLDKECNKKIRLFNMRFRQLIITLIWESATVGMLDIIGIGIKNDLTY